jgi:hypothetical protein
MSDKDEEFEARLAASEKRVAELEAKLAGEPPAPTFKRAPQAPFDPTARATMPPSALRDLVAAVPDKLMADLRSDATKPNPVTGATPAQLTRGDGGQVEIRRGTGWQEPNPLRQPAGVELCDRLLDMADAIDKADLARRLGGKNK